MPREYEDLCERIRKEGGILAFEAAKLIERLSAEYAEKDAQLSKLYDQFSKQTNELAALRAQIAEAQPVAWMSPGKERLEFSRPDTVYGSHTIPLYTKPVIDRCELCADFDSVIHCINGCHEKALHPAADAKDAEDFTGDVQDLASIALRKAWQLGQTYWQQADSEYYSQNKKSDETFAKFQSLVEETRAAIDAAMKGGA